MYNIPNTYGYKSFCHLIIGNGKYEKEVSDKLGKVGRIYKPLKIIFGGKREVTKEIKAEVIKS